MFSPSDRAALRAALLDRARADSRISAAALTGSAAETKEDQWSDIDLAFAAADISAALADFTAYLYDSHAAVHHTDIQAGPWTYRVFLLANTLQVDLAFVPPDHFRALAPTFQLVFGEANPPAHMPPPAAEPVIGMAWLHALHARSALHRNHLWQAACMAEGVRNHALTLACLRLDLPAAHARGFDRLPAAITAPLAAAFPAQLTPAALRDAFEAATHALLAEIQHADPALAARLRAPLLELIQPPF
ncbi:MAG: hypothetical protein SFV54_15210 [Bryobacteraceae bacterium]|nr:hypothetical protein [Bryobacteraceae bacterium]